MMQVNFTKDIINFGTELMVWVKNGSYLYCLKVALPSINVLLNYQFWWYFVTMKDGDCSRSSVSMFTNSKNKIRPLQDHEARGAQIPSTRLQWLLNFVW